ncbi:hypothetical protein HO173_002997 [Letharia columbiana]|uniref:Uncharacterized protein n=1 Tax=Letharia columbiana TaxID=112416 RepID=A0A8H6G2A2_9LECA|nr:uncharacterized protein HO173_002997 [Letharia columbiana]KAF6239125.1 hypothetical protein HO173_002997 [Letharia columbiana]
MEPGLEPYRPPRGMSRLKQVSVDPLESIGLPSKGDNRLLNFKTQEEYFRKVVDRYERCHPHGGDNDTLDGAFASLSIDGISENRSDRPNPISEAKASGSAPQVSTEDSREQSVILMAMRKVREAIVASARKDMFALRAYAFLIRATILMRHMESYHPALLHLLRNIHPVTPLTASEYHEFMGFYILDVSCRQNNLATAFEVKCRYNYKNVRVEAVLKALVHDNWYAFWKVKTLMSCHQQRLLEYSEEGMRRRALECLGKSYLSVDPGFLERSAQRRWRELKEKSNVDWRLEGDVVTIRQIKRK